jgi:hypothetical protein
MRIKRGIDEALAGEFRPGSAARLKEIASGIRRRRDEVRSGKIKPIPAREVYRRIARLLAK